MKTEDGKQYPPSAYLYVPDPDKPSTWKLRIWEDPEKKITVAQLGRAAAALGPGFRGNQVELEPDERRAAARKLIRLYREQGVEDEEIPEYLWEIARMRRPAARMSDDGDADEYVEREAMVFEAGEYPDKGVTVSEEDIRRLARNSAQVPVYVEHAESPIQLGWVQQFIARGRQLWARLRLHREADALLQKLGVNGLSVAVPRSLERVLEVSVTGSPRVASARLFASQGGGVLMFAFGEHPPSDSPEMEVTRSKMEQELEQLTAKIAALEAEREQFRAALEQERRKREEIEFALKMRDVESRVDALVNAGKMPPALRDAMVALGTGANTVRFSSGEEMALFDAFLRVFDSQPSVLGSKLQGNATDTDEELVQRFKAMGLSEKAIPIAVEQYKKQVGVS